MHLTTSNCPQSTKSYLRVTVLRLALRTGSRPHPGRKNSEFAAQVESVEKLRVSPPWSSPWKNSVFAALVESVEKIGIRRPGRILENLRGKLGSSPHRSNPWRKSDPPDFAALVESVAKSGVASLVDSVDFYVFMNYR